jgi:hypothetical protein
MRIATVLFILLLSLNGVGLIGIPMATAQEGASDIPVSAPPTKDSEQTIKEDPVCDPTHRPHIIKIEPDEFFAGDKVVIIGEHFGEKKGCLHEVTFGSEKAKEFTLIGSEKIEATAPDAAPTGMVFINVETGGGAARAAVLIKKKE